MKGNNNSEIIDLRVIARSIIAKRKLFYKTLPIAFVVSTLLIISVPRYYTSEVVLAPELENAPSGGTLSSIASSFGFDLGSMGSADAISPMLYPDLIGSKDFLVSLFNIKVKNMNGDIETTYFDYLDNYQSKAWWTIGFEWITNTIHSLFPEEDPVLSFDGADGTTSPAFMLSKKEDAIADRIQNSIKCSFDKKTEMITISVTDQDKLICASIADSVRLRLQNFITDYRTNKARIDMEYYQKLTAEAKQEYDIARKNYAQTTDANFSPILESVKAKIQDLGNDMQLKYNTYNVMNTQLQAAKAKVQERTPAFTIIEGSHVPIKPSGPKRMIFVIGMLMVTAIGTACYILKDEIKKQITQ